MNEVSVLAPGGPLLWIKVISLTVKKHLLTLDTLFFSWPNLISYSLERVKHPLTSPPGDNEGCWKTLCQDSRISEKALNSQGLPLEGLMPTPRAGHMQFCAWTTRLCFLPFKSCRKPVGFSLSSAHVSHLTAYFLFWSGKTYAEGLWYWQAWLCVVC